jgi:hypothetical protein
VAVGADNAHRGGQAGTPHTEWDAFFATPHFSLMIHEWGPKPGF